MPNHFRSTRAGGTFFFTVRLADHRSDLLVREVDALRRVTRQTRDRLPFEINEIVILPSVIHTIWTLPEGDADFSARWRMLKWLFSRNVLHPEASASQCVRSSEKGIWQRRFWEHMIRDGDDFAAHRHMIHSAPVQAGLAKRMTDWQWSSVHRAIARGDVRWGARVGESHHPLPLSWRTTSAPYGKTFPPLEGAANVFIDRT